MAEGHGPGALPTSWHPGNRERPTQTRHANFLFCLCSIWVPRLWNSKHCSCLRWLFPSDAVPTPQVLVVIWNGPIGRHLQLVNLVGISGLTKLATTVNHYRYYNKSLGWSNVATKLSGVDQAFPGQWFANSFIYVEDWKDPDWRKFEETAVFYVPASRKGEWQDICIFTLSQKRWAPRDPLPHRIKGSEILTGHMGHS